MWPSVARVGAATAAFALVHSALASRVAKENARRWVGEHHYNGLYRLFYVVQSVLLLCFLYVYARSQPDRELYRVRGPLGWLIRAAQVPTWLYVVLIAHHTGVPYALGLRNAAAWLRGQSLVPPPEAQGPRLGADGTVRASGPFAWSRHPANFAGVPVFWLSTSLTTNRLAFNIVATLYLVLGSFHEEARLRAEYGPPYTAYLRSGVPFFVPRFYRSPR